METKLFDSELKVRGVLWREGDTTAKHISDVLKEEVGWHLELRDECAADKTLLNKICRPL